MSSFIKKIKHPITKKEVSAVFLDDYFGNHIYGVIPIDGDQWPDNLGELLKTEKVYREEETFIIKKEINKGKEEIYNLLAGFNDREKIKKVVEESVMLMNIENILFEYGSKCRVKAITHNFTLEYANKIYNIIK